MSVRKKTPGRNGFKYKPQFGVIVICKNQRDQLAAYQELVNRGRPVKVVVV